jgi:hypothetical protein
MPGFMQLYAGHPRLDRIATIKTWMAGTSSAKTRFALLPGHDDEMDCRPSLSGKESAK